MRKSRQRMRAYARKHRNTTPERPPGSNRGWFWTAFFAIFRKNFQGSFWCGCWSILCVRAGGLKVPWTWISVDRAEADAKAKGWWHTDVSKARVGDLVVMFGHGVHIEPVTGNGTHAGVTTTGGNTSKGGRDSNGGGIYEQFRPASEVHGVIRLWDKYPPNPKPKTAAAKKRAAARRKYPLSHKIVLGVRNKGKYRNGTNTWKQANTVRQIQAHLGIAQTGRFDKRTRKALYRKYRWRTVGWRRWNKMFR